MPDRTECEHQNFFSEVGVHRLTDTEGGPVTRYVADIKIRCTDCHQPFSFKGLVCGALLDRPTVSLDGTELRAPIEPAKPLHEQLGYTTQ